MQKITAAIIIIGNEILSGRTQDLNIQYIATKLSENGIVLEEVRVIPDVKSSIIETIRALHAKYTYIFTTGGIGPTHDDITSMALAECFGMKLVKNAEAYAGLKAYYASTGRELNAASEKMAYIPEGAKLIDNSATAAPGFIIKNIYVMAGVPYIMQAMMDFVLPTLQSGPTIESRTISLLIGESLIANEMSDIEKKYPNISVGSYPSTMDGKHLTSVVLRSDDIAELDKAFEEFCNVTEHYARLTNTFHDN